MEFPPRVPLSILPTPIQKCDRLTTMVVPSSSAGTQAGMVLGAVLHGFKGQILGVSIDAPEEDLTTRVTAIAYASASILGQPDAANRIRVHVNAGYLGGGYSVVGELERQALRRMAYSEGILLDPVYTGRAFGGMMDLITQGVIKKSERVLFWHTGGESALSAFADKL